MQDIYKFVNHVFMCVYIYIYIYIYIYSFCFEFVFHTKLVENLSTQIHKCQILFFSYVYTYTIQ